MRFARSGVWSKLTIATLFFNFKANTTLMQYVNLVPAVNHVSFIAQNKDKVSGDAPSAIVLIQVFSAILLVLQRSLLDPVVLRLAQSLFCSCLTFCFIYSFLGHAELLIILHSKTLTSSIIHMFLVPNNHIALNALWPPRNSAVNVDSINLLWPPSHWANVSDIRIAWVQLLSRWV